VGEVKKQGKLNAPKLQNQISIQLRYDWPLILCFVPGTKTKLLINHSANLHSIKVERTLQILSMI